MVVHGDTPLLLLACDCREKFVSRCDANTIEAWPKAVSHKKRQAPDGELLEEEC
jgi:hypothetical protein